MYTINKHLEFNSYINTLWDYFQSYYKSFNKDNNQASKWLNIIDKSNLNMNRNTIIKLINEPNIIFKLTKYVDTSINQIQILKLKFFIILYWLNYLLLVENKNSNSNNSFNFEHILLINWIDSIDSVIRIFESINGILVYNKDTIQNNLIKLENIKYPEKNLESQLNTFKNILNLKSIDILRQLSKILKDHKTTSLVGTNNNMYSLNYTEFIPILMNSIKELKSQVESLKTEVDILKTK